MKKFVIFALFSLYSVAALSGEALSNENYICKRGFLNWKRADSLSVNTLRDGSLQLDMDDRNYNISKDCQLTNNGQIQVQCDKDTNKILLTQKIKSYTGTVISTLSFEQVKGIVIVREREKTPYSTQEIILICRPTN